MIDYILRYFGSRCMIREDDAYLLYDLASQVSEDVLEIGSMYGCSTCVLAAAVRANPHRVQCFAIDPQTQLGNTPTLEGDREGFSEFHPDYCSRPLATASEALESLRQLNLLSYVNFIVGYSELVGQRWNPQHKFGLIFVDGDHRYWFVKRDVELWTPHLVVSGYLILHDVDMESVAAVKGELLASGEYKEQTATRLTSVLVKLQ